MKIQPSNNCGRGKRSVFCVWVNVFHFSNARTEFVTTDFARFLTTKDKCLGDNGMVGGGEGSAEQCSLLRTVFLLSYTSCTYNEFAIWHLGIQHLHTDDQNRPPTPSHVHFAWRDNSPHKNTTKCVISKQIHIRAFSVPMPRAKSRREKQTDQQKMAELVVLRMQF